MSIFGWISRLLGQSPESVGPLPLKGRMPGFDGLGSWINSPPLSREKLLGQVVLVDFWTYSCINCLRTIPYINAWHRAYGSRGLTIIGVHTPEFDFEKDEGGVRSAILRLGVEYPVVLDGEFRLWHSYRNHYWPAHYFVDANGNLRANHFGEGGYEHSESVIRQLLKEAGREIDFPPVWPEVTVDSGKEGAVTPETYLGYNRMEYLGSPEGIAMDRPRHYSVIDDPMVKILYLGGMWELREEFAIPRESGARIVYRVIAAKVNLVMVGPAGGSRISVRLDGQPLTADNKGSDCQVGEGYSLSVGEGRLYNLVNLKEKPDEHLIEITFLEPDIEVYAFTFG